MPRRTRMLISMTAAALIVVPVVSSISVDGSLAQTSISVAGAGWDGGGSGSSTAAASLNLSGTPAGPHSV